MGLKSCTYLTLLLALLGCATPRIPAGAYYEKDTGNYILIRENRARVHIQGMDNRDLERQGLEFDYGLWDDGTMILIVPRSAELLRGYPSLRYWYNGTNIVAKHYKMNREWEFTRCNR